MADINDLDALKKSLWTKPPIPAEEFFEKVNGLAQGARQLCALRAAEKCGVLDLLKDFRSPQEISGKFTHPDLITSLIHVIAEAGFLERSGDKYRCTPLVRTFLTQESPYNQEPYLEKLIWHISDLWVNLPEILNQGPKIYQEEDFFNIRSLPSMATNTLCGRLQETVAAVERLPGFKSARKMIDLGGGHGLYTIALAARNPKLQGIVFDLPGVVSRAEDFIRRYGMGQQVMTVAGNFFSDSIGSGYDIVLSSSNPSGKSCDMIKIIADALNPGGYFVNIQPGDSEPHEDPSILLEWELWTFSDVHIPKKLWEKKKKFYTKDYKEALLQAGFTILSMNQISDPYQKEYTVTLLIAEKTGVTS
ncbi:MAG TPA: methyltransferase [Methanospirillum sp.]|nr:methyltransferase [Methanospirillum sp.]